MISFSNLKSNIPPKARIVIACMLLMPILFFVIFANVFSSDKEDVAAKLPGTSNLSNAPSSRDIKATAPGDKTIIPEESPLYEEIQKDRAEVVEAAKKGGGGFMDRLDFANSEEVVKKNNGTSGDGVVVGLQGTAASNHNAQVEREKARIMAEQNARVTQGMSEAQRKQVANTESEVNGKIEEYVKSKLDAARKANPYSAALQKVAYSTESTIAQNDYSLPGADKPASSERLTATTPTGSRAGGDVLKVEDYLGNMPSTGTAKRVVSQSPNVAPQRTSYQEIVNPVGYSLEPTKTTVNIGEMHYGILQIGVNTDEIGPVRVIIPGVGKLQGAVLVGEPVRVGETASIQLRNMSVNGKDIGVNAVLLNPDTFRPGLADGVDRHTFERYFKLAVAAAADGYVKALTGSSRRTFSDGSSETVIDRLPNADDQFAAAVGRVGEVMIPKFERDFDRPPTVTVDSNRDVVVMFLGSVEI